MESLLNIDYYLFQLINQKLSNPFFDFLLVWMRNEYIWVPLYIFIIAFTIFNYKAKSYWLLLFMFLTVGCSDFISSQVIKKNIKRDRPCRNVHVETVTPRVKCGKAYSFTSSHATNHFAIATFLSFTFGQFFRKIRWPLFTWAGMICLAQVYVGVHFPFDVICGAMLGFFIGYISATLCMKYYGYIFTQSQGFAYL